MAKFGSALEEAVKTYNETVEVPKLYLKALYFSQRLEFFLYQILINFTNRVAEELKGKKIKYSPKFNENWGAKDYLNRIETFLPKESYPDFYNVLEEAINKRNSFIHRSFKTKKGEYLGFNLDSEKFHLNNDSLDNLSKWLNAYSKAEPYIIAAWAKSRKNEKNN